MFYVLLALYIVVGLGLLVGLFALIMHTIGKGLDPQHVLVCSIRLNQPPEAVFDTIADAPGWTTWDPGVTRVEALPDEKGKPACRMVLGHNSMRLVTTRAERPRLIERTVRDEGKRLMFSGSWLHEFKPDGPGCTVTLTERGTIHVPIARAMARKLADPAMYLKRHLKRLGTKFGETPTIQNSPAA